MKFRKTSHITFNDTAKKASSDTQVAINKFIYEYMLQVDLKVLLAQMR